MALHRKRKKVLFFCFGNLRISEWWNLWIEKKPSAKTIKMCFMCVCDSMIFGYNSGYKYYCSNTVITELIAALILMMMMIIVKKMEFSFFLILKFFGSSAILVQLFSSKNQSKKKSDSSNHWFCIGVCVCV